MVIGAVTHDGFFDAVTGKWSAGQASQTHVQSSGGIQFEHDARGASYEAVKGHETHSTGMHGSSDGNFDKSI